MSFIRRQPFTSALLAVLIAVYVVEVAQSSPVFWVAGRGDLPPIAAWGAVWTPAIQGGEWWRIVTAGFVHAGLLHIGLNAYALLIIGGAAELRLESWRALAIFVVAVVGGNVAAAFFDRDAVSLGASGGIMGLAGAIVVAAYRTKEGFERTTWVLSAIVLTVFYGFAHAGISNAAHLGGLFAGAAVAWPLGVSAHYASVMERRRALHVAAVDAVARRVKRQPDFNARGGVELRPSWSYAAIAVVGLLFFGAPLVINLVVGFAPFFLTVVCAAFVVLSLLLLAGLPTMRLRLTDDGLVYRGALWRREVSVPWTAVLAVSTYRVSSAYSTQSWVRVTYVVEGSNGPRERKLLINRMGNMKTEALADLVEGYRHRTLRVSA